ncbi:MAG: YdbL family protein [Calditrichaeota bacterium]|nr:YdbL family protein [Calditrichota bacterium]
MKKVIGFGLLAILSVGLYSCSIKAPEVTITGEKTTLEKQVEGTYQEIENDADMVASTRALEGKRKPVMSIEKRLVLKAIQNRKFNQDDVEEFKRMGIFGENNQGLLEIRNPDKLEKNPELKKRALMILNEENHDRKIIMNRIIQVNENLKNASPEEVQAVFAKMNRENSRPGTWIQLPNGKWVKKK